MDPLAPLRPRLYGRGVGEVVGGAGDPAGVQATAAGAALHVGAGEAAGAEQGGGFGFGRAALGGGLDFGGFGGGVEKVW